MLIAEMPELVTDDGRRSRSYDDLAPVSHDSGTVRGRRTIARGRRALRHVCLRRAIP
ncbi:hypothetical protein [Ciceribacter sp. RN22]|uniref:hypothetical protein n=1 Tax=Ciceribacter sp. RN22 TaxID=2954932 RepID=UPI0035ADADA5